MSKLIGDQEFDEDMTSTFQFECTKDGNKSVWCIDPGNKKIIKGGVDEPTCTFEMTDEDFVKLMKKEVQAAELFMTGRLKLELSSYVQTQCDFAIIYMFALHIYVVVIWAKP